MSSADPQPARGTTAGRPGAAGRLRHAAVSAAVETADATAAVFAGLRRAAAGPRRRIVELAERGAREPVRACRWARETVESAVDAQLRHILRPVVHAVLDDLLSRMEQDPDRIPPPARGNTVDEPVTRTPVPPVPGDGH